MKFLNDACVAVIFYGVKYSTYVVLCVCFFFFLHTTFLNQAAVK